MRKLIILLFVLLWPNLVSAGYDEALTAFNKRDYKTAAKEYRIAAEQGDAKAQYELGRMYDLGDGVQQDLVQAAEWYRKAAEQDNADAQHELGRMYKKGNGVQQDVVQAAEWYRKYRDAMEKYRKAAEQGDHGAQRELADMYSDGEDIPSDYIQAYMWYTLAASTQNNQEVMYIDISFRNMMNRMEYSNFNAMTDNEVYEAQKEALRLAQGKFRNQTERDRLPVYVLRELSKNNFCIALGQSLRGEWIYGVGDFAYVAPLVKAEAARRKLSINNKSLITGKKIKTGMSECELYASWGLPDSQHRSVGSWGVHTQNIYVGGNYVYTENGRVTSWQD